MAKPVLSATRAGPAREQPGWGTRSCGRKAGRARPPRSHRGDTGTRQRRPPTGCTRRAEATRAELQLHRHVAGGGRDRDRPPGGSIPPGLWPFKALRCGVGGVPGPLRAGPAPPLPREPREPRQPQVRCWAGGEPLRAAPVWSLRPPARARDLAGAPPLGRLAGARGGLGRPRPCRPGERVSSPGPAAGGKRGRAEGPGGGAGGWVSRSSRGEGSSRPRQPCPAGGAGAAAAGL